MLVIKRMIPRENHSQKKSNKPVIITWKGVKMLRSQSINACVHEIYESSKSMGFIKINLIGASSSGKTVLSNVLSHQLHSLDPSFEVHFFEDHDLIDFKKTIQGLSKNNQILTFDDLSGLEAKYGLIALKKLEADITTIRHINKLEDRKIIMLLNFHAQKKLSKFLRISNFTFYTDCQNEEIGYLEELLGSYQKPTIVKFAKLRAQSRMFHKFTFPLGRKDYFTYKDGDPFRVLLYNNGLSTRFVVSPQVSWILEDKICQTCTPSEKTEETKKNLEHFVKDFSRCFGPGLCKRAVKNKLLRQGLDVAPKREGQAEQYINQYFDVKNINLEELGKVYGLEPRNTRLYPDKQPSFQE